MTTPGPGISPIRTEWLRVFPLLAAIVVVWLIEMSTPARSLAFPPLRYLAIHTAFETTALIFAALSFGLLWMAPDTARRRSMVLLASALVSASVLDFLHMLSYEGMPTLVTPAGTEKAIAFWLAGRAFMVAGLLAVAFPVGDLPVSRSGRGWIVLLGLLLATAFSWVVLYRSVWLPTTFVPGQGLTSVKVGAELMLIGLLLAAAWALQRRAVAQAQPAFATLAAAAVLAAAGEVCFASYSSVTDLFNAVGHVAKIASYWHIARAAYLLTVRQPLAAHSGLAEALQATQNPAFVCTVQGQIRWANAAFLQTTGLSSTEAERRDLDSLEVEGDEAAWAAMRMAMRAGRTWKGQVRARHGDGSLFVDDRSVTPIRDSHGHVNGFVVVGDDITERERQAAVVRASEERLRALLDAAPDAVVVIDARGHVLLANPEVQRMFGYSVEEITGKNVSLLMPPAVAAQHDGYLERHLRTGLTSIIGTGRDVLAQRKDGQLLHVHLTVGKVSLAGAPAFIGFMRDISERIRVQNELAEREERYRALMDTAIDGVWIADCEARILVVNDAYCRRSGYSREELLQMRIQDLEVNEDTEGVAAHIARVMDRGHDTFETRHRTKSGDIWPVEITVTFWTLGAGQFFVFARDLTERQTSALALKQSEERLELALRGTNDGLWDRDLIQDSLYLSPRWKAILGYRDDELPNDRQTFAALLHPFDALAVHLALDEVVSGQGPERFEMEMRMRHKDGHWAHVLSRGQLMRDATGRPIRLAGTHQDLTERKQAEAALRDSEEMLRNLFELSPLGIALCTMEGHLVQFNEAYRKLTGHSAQTLQRLSYWDLTPVEYIRSERDQLDALARDDRYGPYEKEYLRADGTRVPVRLNGVRMSVKGEMHVWSIVEDLTTTRAMEQERQAMQRQQMQSQKLEALGHLTGGIAHDFNNMLAGIMGLASLGLERFITEPDGKLAQYLREIVHTTERGRDLVAKMLAYVRTEEPGIVGARDLAPLLVEMCGILRSTIPSTIEVDCRHEDELPPVRISAVDMHQIIMNLVINARDAVGEQGSITIRLGHRRRVQEECCDCRERMDGDFVVLEVGDNGPGIPPDVRPKIFDPFFTTKEVGKGTGLGLSSVIGLVHKAGGHMQVAQAQPQGTVMRVFLPCAAERVDVVESIQMPLLARQRSDARLWVVDDDPAVLVFLTELLRENGFRVTGFSSPSQALQAFGQPENADALPSVLITDQTMPGLSGTELARGAMALVPGLVVVLCTGYSELVDAESARAMGIHQFLRKPFDSADLLAALDEVLAPPRR